MLIEYSSNNSGGYWWLEDEDWRKLEAAGWHVEWLKERWLGSMATTASKQFETPSDAMKEFEIITGKKVDDEGCNCCGPPHSFSWDGGYASGEDCLQYLFKKPMRSLREMYEQERKE